MMDTDEWVRVFKESLRTENDIFTVYYVNGTYVVTRVDARKNEERERWEVHTDGL